MTRRRQILFVTGRLAEPALRRVVLQLAEQEPLEPHVAVLPITVAALMTPGWIARHLQVPPDTDEIWLPGYCQGDLGPLQHVTDVPLYVGPRDLYDLPGTFGQPSRPRPGYGSYDIEILAEINHAPQQPLDDIVKQAQQLSRDGADVIDLGCTPGHTWMDVGQCVRALRDHGLRVSIDSMNIREIELAVEAGAELVLSVNQENLQAAADWQVEVVAIPDQPRTLDGLENTLEQLAAADVSFRIDPILEPIGCGLAASLGRYLEVRRRYPDANMLMGIGNLTELTDADSAAINVLLLGFCQELSIRSVLTTQVINWARTSVRECDLARRLVHYAVEQGTIPKHVEPGLILLRDEKIPPRTAEELDHLSRQIRDPNYRVFVAGGKLHLVSASLHLASEDPYILLHELLALEPKNLDASHAFYLGYELAKARTALTLGKEYRQDESLDWGFLTLEEPRWHHRQLGTAGKQAEHEDESK